MRAWVSRRHGAAVLSALALAWALIVIVVDPRGDFPLNDDWNFAFATWHFAEHGEFQFSRLTGMSLRAQVLYGAAWTLLFGKSFEILRYSVLALAVLGGWIIHRTLSLANAPLTARWVGAIALLVNPIYFWSSFTYMTHVPFVVASAGALYCHIRGVRDRALGWMVLGACMVVTSYFVRQTGISNAIPPLVALALASGETIRSRVRLALPAITAMVAFVVMYFGTAWLAGYPGQLSVHYEAWDVPLGKRILTGLGFAARYTSSTLQYVGLFFVPLLVPAVARVTQDRLTRLALLAAAPVTVWSASAYYGLGQLAPYGKGGRILNNLALGPLTLRDTWIFEYPYTTHLERAGQWVLTLFAVVGGAILGAVILATAWRAIRLRTDWFETADLTRLLAVSQILVGTALLWVSGIYFDRYSLDAMWALVILLPLTGSWSRASSVSTVVASALMLVLVMAGVSEYLEWNRARWRAFHAMTNAGITLEEMDGGYEINQFLLGGQHGEILLDKEGMSVVDDKYILSFNRDVRGFRAISRFPYERWWRRPGSIYVQVRTTGYRPAFTDEDLRD